MRIALAWQTTEEGVSIDDPAVNSTLGEFMAAAGPQCRATGGRLTGPSWGLVRWDS